MFAINSARWYLILVTLLGLLSPAQAESIKPIIIGLHPHVSLKTTLTIYGPLQNFLQKELGREVTLSSSADVKTFFARVLEGQYDIAVIAPHMARVAQLKGNFIPVAYYANELSGVVIVRKNSPFFQAKSLRGKEIGLSGPYTFTNIAGRNWLRDRNLQPGADIKVREFTLHDQVAVALDQGHVDGAIIGSLSLLQLPKGLSERFRVIGNTDVLPGQFFIANPKLPASLTAQVKSLLQQFPKTQMGQDFLRSNGFGGLLTVNDAVLTTLDPYAKQLINIMENE